MKTNLPIAVCLIDYFFFMSECAVFTLFDVQIYYVSSEGLPETSEEGLTLELSAFETLYSGQFETST